MKIVFMGTPEFAVPTLEALADNGHNIKLVITQPDKKQGRGKKVQSSPIKIKAQDLGIEVFQPKNVNSIESIEKLKVINPDIIIVVAYGQILKEEILKLPKYGCINVHASLLPYYRGAAPINWAIINGEKKSGVTIMYMDKGLDTGDMILKKEIDIDYNDNAKDLHDKLKYLGANALIEALVDIESGKVTREKQNNEIATYAPMLDKKIGLIDWNQNGERIRNLVRGINPWPGAYFIYNNEKVKIFEVELIDKLSNEIGKIVKVDKDGIIINAKDKSVIIKEIQFPGKKRMKVEEFLKGNSIKEGYIF